MLVLVDTNVVLRVIEPRHQHHIEAVGALRGLRQAGHELCIVPQIHYEFWVVATRSVTHNGLGMTPEEAAAELANLGPPLFRFLRDERAIYGSWRELVGKYAVLGRQAHDARLIAAMERHDLTHLLTFNTSDFGRYAGKTILDPKAIAAS